MFTYWTRRDKVPLSLRIFDERSMVVVDNSHDAKMLWVQHCSDYSDQVIARRTSLYLQCHDKLSQIVEDKAY